MEIPIHMLLFLDLDSSNMIAYLFFITLFIKNVNKFKKRRFQILKKTQKKVLCVSAEMYATKMILMDLKILTTEHVTKMRLLR